jgi:hypothetical protein
MGRCRISFRDENGKRHWAPRVHYIVPEGVVFGPGDKVLSPRSRIPQGQSATDGQSASVPEKEPGQSVAGDGNLDR